MIPISLFLLSFSWIVNEDIPKDLKNTATRYYINKDDFVGTTDEPKPEYDLMEVVMIRRGEAEDIAEPLFKYLESVYNADIEEIDKYTPVSSNPELKKEVESMPGMSQVIYNQGVSEGINQGITQGEEKKQTDNIKQLAEYFIKESPEITMEQATEMAKNILK